MGLDYRVSRRELLLGFSEQVCQYLGLCFPFYQVYKYTNDYTTTKEERGRAGVRLLFGGYYCPNPDCPQERLESSQKCPKCDTMSEKFGTWEAGELMQQKEVRQRIREGTVEITVSEEMSEEELKHRTREDLINLAVHQYGWMKDKRLHLIGNATELILGTGFRTLIEQNNIIIRQNELILRALKKKNSV